MSERFVVEVTVAIPTAVTARVRLRQSEASVDTAIVAKYSGRGSVNTSWKCS